MVSFNCKRSGNVVSFNDENDIEKMRNHEGYEEVKYELQEEETAKKRQTLKLRSKNGTT